MLIIIAGVRLELTNEHKNSLAVDKHTYVQTGPSVTVQIEVMNTGSVFFYMGNEVLGMLPATHHDAHRLKRWVKGDS